MSKFFPRPDRISIVAIVLGVFLVAFFAYRTHETVQFLTTTFGGVPISLEVVTTDAAKQLGLAGRASISDNYGMLFVFAKDGYYGFWMKGMLVPIDLYWLDGSGRVVTLYRGVDPSTYPHVFYPSASARSVLETRAGFGLRNGIREGSTLILPSSVSVSQ